MCTHVYTKCICSRLAVRDCWLVWPHASFSLTLQLTGPLLDSLKSEFDSHKKEGEPDLEKIIKTLETYATDETLSLTR